VCPRPGSRSKNSLERGGSLTQEVPDHGGERAAVAQQAARPTTLTVCANTPRVWKEKHGLKARGLHPNSECNQRTRMIRWEHPGRDNHRRTRAVATQPHVPRGCIGGFTAGSRGFSSYSYGDLQGFRIENLGTRNEGVRGSSPRVGFSIHTGFRSAKTRLEAVGQAFRSRIVTQPDIARR